MLIDFPKPVVKLSHHISLNHEGRQDIQWWADYLPSWNGRHKILDSTTTPCHMLDIFTDASGEIGLGMFYKGRWVSFLPGMTCDNHLCLLDTGISSCVL